MSDDTFPTGSAGILRFTSWLSPWTLTTDTGLLNLRHVAERGGGA